ncbi:hypothetical protein TanjilG_12195 [Lupinus angustifolius]|uniref:Uncharacterized protein n=1 Tax=Lupinus angustifolius TaxID=3871 RepID=A0A1J7GMG5_LUPAN|nr:hypothetical protein TanjilG_12195 [Lupinus angustifolius]
MVVEESDEGTCGVVVEASDEGTCILVVLKNGSCGEYDGGACALVLDIVDVKGGAFVLEMVVVYSVVVVQKSGVAFYESVV